MEKKKISLKEIGLPKLIMVFVAGILIIVLSFPGMFNTKKPKQNSSPSINKTEIQQNDKNTTSYSSNTYITEMENKLKTILKKVSGIGQVEVMITLKSSEEQVPLKDTHSTQESLNEADGEGGNRANNNVQQEENTVLADDGNGNSVPYILKELEPKVEGIVVIAEGGSNDTVKLEIMEAAQALFDVPANKIKVMKMGNGKN